MSKDRAGTGPTKEELTPSLMLSVPSTHCLGGQRIKLEICPECCGGLKSM